MAELINNNVFASDKKFVDLSSLDYFWDKAKSYIDGVDEGLTGRVKTNEDAIRAINDELNSLSGGAGSIQTQIANAIEALNLPNTYEAKGEAAKAEASAKAYADGLAANYDAAGAAEAVRSSAEGLDVAMDARVKVLEAIDHAKLAEDASAAAVATVLDGAPEAFNTLKEVAAWIANSETAAEAADLVTRVAALEAINHDAYVDADAKVLEDANAYADGLAGNYDAAGSAEAGLPHQQQQPGGRPDHRRDQQHHPGGLWRQCHCTVGLCGGQGRVRLCTGARTGCHPLGSPSAGPALWRP